tara:strand:- start:7540 stop:8457 length:918 start_codon:yes stop_codon:yes gene_type:complete
MTIYVDIEKILKDNKLFWQYPVCTEKKFYLQNKEDISYLGFPWATMIDSGVNYRAIAELASLIDADREYYTCCQHIYFRDFALLFSDLNIKTVYTPHKEIGEDVIEGIDLLPCPLYAVNVEDPQRNAHFQGQDFMENKRDLLFSFIGYYRESYLSDVRAKILNLKDDEGQIEKLENWHFEEIVYSSKQNYDNRYDPSQSHEERTGKYNQTLLNSRYSLCPSGAGPNSIRFWESLAVGAIPVLLADTLELPKHDLWNEAILRVKEDEVESIPDLLKSISEKEERERRAKCLEIYSFYRNNYKNDKS